LAFKNRSRRLGRPLKKKPGIIRAEDEEGPIEPLNRFNKVALRRLQILIARPAR
jgi:hypothetical protein